MVQLQGLMSMLSAAEGSFTQPIIKTSQSSLSFGHGIIVSTISHLLCILMTFVINTLHQGFMGSFGAADRSSVYEHGIVNMIATLLCKVIGFVTKAVQITKGLMGRPLYTIGHAIISLVINLLSKMMDCVGCTESRWKLTSSKISNSQRQGVVLDLIPNNVVMQKGRCIHAYTITKSHHSHSSFHGSSNHNSSSRNSIQSLTSATNGNVSLHENSNSSTRISLAKPSISQEICTQALNSPKQSIFPESCTRTLSTTKQSISYEGCTKALTSAKLNISLESISNHALSSATYCIFHESSDHTLSSAKRSISRKSCTQRNPEHKLSTYVGSSSERLNSAKQSISKQICNQRSSEHKQSIPHGSSNKRISAKQSILQHGHGALSPPLLCTLLLLTTIVAVASAQEFQILAKNVGISAMHAAVTRYGTVVLLDRTDIGPTKLKLAGGQCRNNTNDLALQYDCWAHSVLFTPGRDEASTTFRPLTVITDTMCSSGQFLPDGTLLQLGGENDGLKKVRHFKPCLPRETKCDWVEQPGNGLKSGRWYSTSAILPDGRIIVVGGRTIFTYEFIPPVPNNGISFTLDLLKITKDVNADNLYPYVHLLPDDTIFIFANRDSIQLDYRVNRVIRTFPTIPGEPRNYPSAGSSVLLPLLFSQDFKDPEVMICGGADVAAFRHPERQMPCSETCGRLKLWNASPHWEMEIMPIRRCMGDMVLLPTRQLLIINGAQNGSQGFGYASNPALNPVVYDFYSREFVTFPATNIPRMYHSTANLLPDGRVLLAGSNSQQFYEYVGDFPTELRVEAWLPPYLSESVKGMRPSIIAFPERIEYQKPFSVVFSVSEMPNDVEMNLISSPFTTHSYSQGQRLVHLKVTLRTVIDSGVYNVTVIGPPSPSVAPPSYYMLFPVQSGIVGSAVWVQVVHLH